MFNITSRMRFAACAGLFAAVAAHLLDAYIQMVVTNTELHFLFGYLDGVIVMGMIMVYIKRYSTTATGGK